MKAIRYHQTGGPEVLSLDDVPTPEPGPGEVLIRVAAAGVNYADLLRRQGVYPIPGGLPCGYSTIRAQLPSRQTISPRPWG